MYVNFVGDDSGGEGLITEQVAWLRPIVDRVVKTGPRRLETIVRLRSEGLLQRRRGGGPVQSMEVKVGRGNMVTTLSRQRKHFDVLLVEVFTDVRTLVRSRLNSARHALVH